MTTHVFLERIKYYESEVSEENEGLKTTLQKMTADYELITDKVVALEDTKLLDFHSRRLVEMAGNIIMGYLLVLNSQRDAKFSKSARLFVNLASSENKEKFSYINNFDIADLELYKLHEIAIN